MEGTAAGVPYWEKGETQRRPSFGGAETCGQTLLAVPPVGALRPGTQVFTFSHEP